MKQFFFAENRIKYIKYIVEIFLILGMAMSHTLWTGDRKLPFVPIISSLEGVPIDYLSFSLYSEKSKIFYIAISDKYIGELNHKYDDYFLKMDANVQGGKVIDVNKWAMKELNVPIYPE